MKNKGKTLLQHIIFIMKNSKSSRSKFEIET